MLKRIFLRVTLSVAFGFTLLIPLAQAADQPAAAPPQPQAQSQTPVRQAAALGVHNITQAAVKAGVLSCTSRINQVSNFLTAGAPQGVNALLFPLPNNPDQQLVSVSLGIPSTETSSAYASASFAPNQANGCGGMYETVVYWPMGCNDVAANNFSGLKIITELTKNITVLDGGITTKIFLMSAGAGCVAIKKEVIR
jgi:hypothetical protein